MANSETTPLLSPTRQSHRWRNVTLILAVFAAIWGITAVVVSNYSAGPKISLISCGSPDAFPAAMVADVEGRYLSNTNGSISFDWPSVILRFTATNTHSVGICMNGTSNFLARAFDVGSGDGTSDIHFMSGEHMSDSPVVVAKGLHKHKSYLIVVERLNEPSFEPFMESGPTVTTVRTVNANKEGKISYPESEQLPSNKTLTVLSDSLANGFCILGSKDDDDDLSKLDFMAMQDASKSWPRLLATSLGNWRLEDIALSGRGVLTDYARAGTPTMDTYLDRVFGSSHNEYKNQSWEGESPTRRVPDLVIIALGGNDYYEKPYPFTEEEFEIGYSALVNKTISTLNISPDRLLNICGGELKRQNEPPCVHIEAVAKATKSKYFHIPANAVEFPGDQSCADHWTPDAAVRVSDLLSKFLSSDMGL